MAAGEKTLTDEHADIFINEHCFKTCIKAIFTLQLNVAQILEPVYKCPNVHLWHGSLLYMKINWINIWLFIIGFSVNSSNEFQFLHQFHQAKSILVRPAKIMWWTWKWDLWDLHVFID